MKARENESGESFGLFILALGGWRSFQLKSFSPTLSVFFFWRYEVRAGMEWNGAGPTSAQKLSTGSIQPKLMCFVKEKNKLFVY